MEPMVLDDLYFIDLEVWMFVNEIVMMEAWTNGAYGIGWYIFYCFRSLDVCKQNRCNGGLD